MRCHDLVVVWGIMEIISDIEKDRARVESLIQAYGCAAEHQYYCYTYNIEPWEKPFVFIFADGTGILAKYDPRSSEWTIFSEILAPPEKKTERLLTFLNHVFAGNLPVKKVWVELESQTRKAVLETLRTHHSYKANKINYTLTWPVFDLLEWTGDTFEGKDWKDMRYYWNKYFREHHVEFVSALDVSTEELLQVVDTWKAQRTTGDKTFAHYYRHAIVHGFKGFDYHRIMRVDGKVQAITAGFFPRDGYYYSSIGIALRDIDRTGEIANIDDLRFLKSRNVRIADFGGGEKTLTTFKKKFRPTRYYKTHIFSIVSRTVNTTGKTTNTKAEDPSVRDGAH